MAKDKKKKVGVVLAGSGVYDGSELHEAVITLLALDEAGAEIICMAPNIDQMHVIDHIKGEPVTGEKRNVLTESARIARGDIIDMAKINAQNLDALIIPGGFGAAKNLCTFATEGNDCLVNPEVDQVIKQMHAAQKPIGFICIAPALAAKVLGGHQPLLTIGNDKATAQAIEQMGGRHQDCSVDDIVVDETNRIVSTPAYMLGPTISQVAKGIHKCVAKVLEMA
ncbi:MAG TPA: isoprenoid biosynthesis glyoxalase ElbB [bacterium]|nr:isoprenoid biosynthesis glyoxalase ElbB [bacterium]